MVAHNKLYAIRCTQYLTVDADSFLTDPQHRAIKTTQQRSARHRVGARHIGRVGQFGVRAKKMAAVQLLSGVMRYAYNRPTAAAQAFHKAAI
jgi:hypothetical protein